MARLDYGNGISYDPDGKQYIMLDLTEYIPEQLSIEVDDELLLPKHEYHSSLVALGRYINDKDERVKIALSIQKYLATNALHYVELGIERYVCRKDDRMTLIAPVLIQGIDNLAQYVSTLIPDYDPPFPHVTLLKSESTEFGIGINSSRDFDQYCAPLG